MSDLINRINELERKVEEISTENQRLRELAVKTLEFATREVESIRSKMVEIQRLTDPDFESEYE